MLIPGLERLHKQDSWEVEGSGRFHSSATALGMGFRWEWNLELRLMASFHQAEYDERDDSGAHVLEEQWPSAIVQHRSVCDSPVES